MVVSATPQLIGVRDTLAVLKTIEPKLERQVKAQIRRAGAPLQAGVRARIPATSPMSGWTRGRYRFDGGSASSGVRVRAGGRASNRRSQWPLLTITQTDAGGVVFDMAGRRSSGHSPQGRAFIRNLNAYGRASRALWPGVEQNMGVVQREVIDALDKAAAQVNRTLARRGSF